MKRLILSPRTEFPNGKCAFHLLAFTRSTSVLGILTWIAFDPIFRKKVAVEMERAHPRENVYLGIDASHLLQL